MNCGFVLLKLVRGRVWVLSSQKFIFNALTRLWLPTDLIENIPLVIKNLNRKYIGIWIQYGKSAQTLYQILNAPGQLHMFFFFSKPKKMWLNYRIYLLGVQSKFQFRLIIMYFVDCINDRVPFFLIDTIRVHKYIVYWLVFAQLHCRKAASSCLYAV